MTRPPPPNVVPFSRRTARLAPTSVEQQRESILVAAVGSRAIRTWDDVKPGDASRCHRLIESGRIVEVGDVARTLVLPAVGTPADSANDGAARNEARRRRLVEIESEELAALKDDVLSLLNDDALWGSDADACRDALMDVVTHVEAARRAVRKLMGR